MIFLLGFLYIFCSVALFVNARKNWLLRRLKRTYPEEDYSNNVSRGSFFVGKKQGWNGSKKQGLGNVNNSPVSGGRKTISGRLSSWLVKNNIRADVVTFVLIFLVALSLIFTVSIFFKNGILIFISVSIFLSLAAYIFMDIRGRKILQKKEDQLEGFLIDLTGNLYANPNVLISMQKTLELAEDPLKSEFETVIEDTRRGILLNEALFGMIERNKSEIIRMVISGFIASNEKGVDLIEYLKDQLDYIREKKSISSYIRILSSGPRYTSYVIMLIPVAVVCIVSLLNKNFAQSLLNGFGLGVLIYALLSYIAGFLIINRIVNLAEKAR
jgi:Flp pilus assembly protein TadB